MQERKLCIAESDEEVKAGKGFAAVIEHFHHSQIRDPELGNMVVDAKYLGTTLIASTIPAAAKYLAECLERWEKGLTAPDITRTFGR
jgi:hypothetical protein